MKLPIWRVLATRDPVIAYDSWGWWVAKCGLCGATTERSPTIEAARSAHQHLPDCVFLRAQNRADWEETLLTREDLIAQIEAMRPWATDLLLELEIHRRHIGNPWRAAVHVYSILGGAINGHGRTQRAALADLLQKMEAEKRRQA